MPGCAGDESTARDAIRGLRSRLRPESGERLNDDWRARRREDSRARPSLTIDPFALIRGGDLDVPYILIIQNYTSPITKFRQHSRMDLLDPSPASGWRLPPGSRQPAGSPRLDCRAATAPGSGASCFAFAGPGYPRRGRLHGPGQLGHRPRRRRALRLHAAQRDHDFEPDGDPAAGPRRAAGHCQRTRPGAGLPRQLLASGRRSRSGCCARSRSPRAIWPK